ncbi:hypothetical protein EPUS_00688 [Endocarpon pusillum Z07020]|uniref:Protein NO VEIN C-terminal domain-containing protein n=1 Tax=Endocarpon pusillum (strain Z07020 / HMAS-L-300199) TaxID=1263415 RepID=U1GQE1_ENDPU|nr:uncharacterized protein EPUS_00688 [Endocarpon pusillum Z07020]ERF74558.1 hypothetical protein EPUS_00688 [Endocarpon pusillum Z07020]
MKYGRLSPRDTSEEICKCCGIGDEKWKSLITDVLFEEDDREIEDMLSRRKIGGYNENDLDAVLINVTAQNCTSAASQLGRPSDKVEARSETKTSSTISLQQTSSEEVRTQEPAVLKEILNQSRPPKMPYQGYASAAPGPELTSRDLKQAARQAEIGEAVLIGGRENVAPQTYASNGSGYLAKIKPNRMIRPAIRPKGKSSLHHSTHERPVVMVAGRDHAQELKVGVRGEEAVFNILRDILGSGIDESSWTTELRHHVHGYKLWAPEDRDTLYSDFTVRDEAGKLMKWMIDNDVKFPTYWETGEGDMLYHIEVKATAKEHFNEPFFMSYLQMDKAKEIARSKSSHGVREAFVIFRVYDTESQVPGLEVYYDPWTLIQEGKLTCQAQEWRISPA